MASYAGVFKLIGNYYGILSPLVYFVYSAFIKFGYVPHVLCDLRDFLFVMDTADTARHSCLPNHFLFVTELCFCFLIRGVFPANGRLSENGARTRGFPSEIVYSYVL